jgi:hypothetical protein
MIVNSLGRPPRFAQQDQYRPHHEAPADKGGDQRTPSKVVDRRIGWREH